MQESNLDQNSPVSTQNNIPQAQSPVQPVENQVRVSKPASKNKLSLILIVIFALLIILSSGAYYYLGIKTKNTNQQKQTSIAPTTVQNSPKPTADPTANWKTYTSKYGYSFKYSQSWAANESVGDRGVVVYSKPEYIQLSEQLGPGFNKEDYATIGLGMYLNGQQAADNSPKANGNQTINQNTDVKDFVNRLYYSIIQSTEDTTLSGKPAVLVTFKRMVLPPGVPLGSQDPPIQDGTTKSVWTKYNGNILFINYHYGRQFADYNTLPTIFNQILSTFKFTP